MFSFNTAKLNYRRTQNNGRMMNCSEGNECIRRLTAHVSFIEVFKFMRQQNPQPQPTYSQKIEQNSYKLLLSSWFNNTWYVFCV